MKRIQRKRTKGWKMPPDTVYVGRPTKWGNPYKVHDPPYLETILDVIGEYRRWLCVQLFRDPHFLDPLRGKDLACWCRLDQPCHADVLLKEMELRR